MSEEFNLLLEMQAIGLDSMGQSWYDALRSEFNKNYFIELAKFVEEEREKFTINPAADDVFSWTQFCSITDVKVVIVGQDPYHKPEYKAHGLAFSVKPDSLTSPQKIPGSLGKIFKELSHDISGFQHPGHGDLTEWAKRGVLLLNSILTVRAGKGTALSHEGRGWELFTEAVIKCINGRCNGIVFLLWGDYAKARRSIINESRHHVLTSYHPSPLSAYRGFLGCRHFSQTSALLKAQGKEEINWHLPLSYYKQLQNRVLSLMTFFISSALLYRLRPNN